MGRSYPRFKSYDNYFMQSEIVSNFPVVINMNVQTELMKSIIIEGTRNYLRCTVGCNERVHSTIFSEIISDERMHAEEIHRY